VVAIAGGSSHSLALKSDGSVWAWGYNNSGSLGNGSSDFSAHSTPAAVSGLTGVVAIAAGDQSLALKSDGSVWAWGDNFYGELGDGTTTQRNSPVASGLTSGVAAINAGEYNSLALK
jgi:alpha-tubulin suppressor-like RCC1 family protein